MPGPVMPGVRRTPGRLRGGDAPGGPDPPRARATVPLTLRTLVCLSWRLACRGRTLAVEGRLLWTFACRGRSLVVDAYGTLACCGRPVVTSTLMVVRTLLLVVNK